MDKSDKKPLSNTNILLLRTKLGGAAGNDGVCFISKIPPGHYDLKASRIGYETQVIKNISLKAGEIKTINIEMTTRVMELDSIGIEAKRFNG